jgi:hypothetical protein
MAESHQNIMQQFFGLANRLSPENLSCDGEISKAQVQVRYRQIMREWAALERRVGQKVSLEEVEEEQFKKWRSGMDNRKLSKELLFVAKSLLGTDFPSQEALDKYLKDHPKANRSNHKVVKDPKDETPDEVEDRMKKEQGPAYRTQEQRLEDAKPKHGPAQGDKTDEEMGKGLRQWVQNFNDPKTSPANKKQLKKDIDKTILDKGLDRKRVWDDMTPTQRAEAKSKDRQDAKEKAKKSAVASQLLFLAKEVIGMDFPTQDAMDKYLREHPDADKTNHRVVETEKAAPAKEAPKAAPKAAPKPKAKAKEIEGDARDFIYDANKGSDDLYDSDDDLREALYDWVNQKMPETKGKIMEDGISEYHAEITDVLVKKLRGDFVRRD